MRPSRLALVASFSVALGATVSAQSVSTARERAMGGTGAASALPENAAFVNPALTRHRDERTGRSLVAPFAAGLARDPEELVSGLDDFQTALDELRALVNSGNPDAATRRPFVASQLARLDGREISVEAQAGVAALFPMEDYSLTVAARVYSDLRGIPVIDPGDVAAISDVSGPAADLDNLLSEAAVVGATVTEFGATFAFEAEVNRRRLSFGITPKAQWIETSNFATGVTSFDNGDALDDFRDKEFRSAFSDLNVDVGLAYQLDDGVTVGLAATNLLRNSYDTKIVGDRQYTYWVEPRPTAGVALEEAGFTFTADLDLVKTTRFRDAGDSQFIRMGFEYNAFGWGQLRAGFSHDFQNTLQDVFSFGLGLPRVGPGALNLVGQVGNHSIGAGLQATWSL